MKNNILFNRMDFVQYDKAHNNGSKQTLPSLLIVAVALMVSEGCAVKQSSAIDTKSNTAVQAEPTEIRINSTEFSY